MDLSGLLLCTFCPLLHNDRTNADAILSLLQLICLVRWLSLLNVRWQVTLHLDNLDFIKDLEKIVGVEVQNLIMIRFGFVRTGNLLFNHSFIAFYIPHLY